MGSGTAGQDDAAGLARSKRALVIGGGIAGIQAALDLANARIRVTLVEKSPSLGGRMAQLDKTFPTMDCSI
jgi:heterodisulfide reductase subunit A